MLAYNRETGWENSAGKDSTPPGMYLDKLFPDSVPRGDGTVITPQVDGGSPENPGDG